MKIRQLKVYCPHCGAKVIQGKKATEVIKICTRCTLPLNATIGEKYVYIEIIDDQRRKKAVVNSS